MDLSDLLIFRTVADEGGIVKAARKLHRVPSSVTTRVQQLEASVAGWEARVESCGESV